MSIRSLLLVFGILLSSPSFAGGLYDLKSVSHEDLDQELLAGSDLTGTPKNLQGLWWLDGNPLPDEVMSLASARWSKIEKNGRVVGYEAVIPVYDQGIWAWHDSLPGRFLYSLVLASRLTYIARFNADFSFGQITPKFIPLQFLPGVEIPASLLVDFTMTLVDDGEYQRDSILFGARHSYRFRRIVDGEGNRLPAYDEFVEKAEVNKALLPICRLPSQGFPTACVR